MPDPRKSVVLAPVLDLKAAAPLADEFLAARGFDLSVNGSAVQRVGAQCLQVLLAARMTWAAERAGFEIIEPSEPLLDTAALLGASAALFEPTEKNP